MTKDKINVEYFEDKGFQKVWCSEGHYMSNWDKKDILEYTSAKVLYAPIGYDWSDYYCVSDEMNEQYTAQQEAKLKEMENNK